MKTIVYDKALWHIDGGESVKDVLKHFEYMMAWCSSNNLLSSEGQEIESLGVDDSISLHSRMFNERGNAFMSGYYDQFIAATPEDKEKMDNVLASL